MHRWDGKEDSREAGGREFDSHGPRTREIRVTCDDARVREPPSYSTLFSFNFWAQNMLPTGTKYSL